MLIYKDTFKKNKYQVWYEIFKYFFIFMNICFVLCSAYRYKKLIQKNYFKLHNQIYKKLFMKLKSSLQINKIKLINLKKRLLSNYK